MEEKIVLPAGLIFINRIFINKMVEYAFYCKTITNLFSINLFYSN